ncbi:hypothetical protein BJY01DRAFT_241277 [Aspergillus pseudoustus]|uniref:Phospholipase/carboxylesterase/thioesterase domain-containing protein n=1 Tax=Aspergillus pseudoustus TaxID=1810923 RepID=A0ABR4IGP1_9EURO
MPNEPSLPTPQWDGPLVFPPTSTEHTHTIILLQGHTGTTASGLVSGRLESTFPSAKKRPTPAWSVRTFTRTWFDLYSLDDPSERDYTQIVGLEDTSRYLRSLIHAEATELLQSGIPCESEGYDRIIVGGFGQGFAASIFAVLGGDGVPAGYIGLNGCKSFWSSHKGTVPPDDADPRSARRPRYLRFPARTGPGWHPPNPSTGTLRTVDTQIFRMPVFLGYRMDRRKGSMKLAADVEYVLKRGMGVDVTWKEYDMDSGDTKEVDDIIDFLSNKVGVPRAPTNN